MLRMLVAQGPDKGQLLETTLDELILGRDVPHVGLRDNTVSRRHARLSRRQERWYLEDLGSANGTLHNGLPVRAPIRVKPGDQIRVGKTLLVCREASAKLDDFDVSEVIKLDAQMSMSDDNIVARRPANDDSMMLDARDAAQNLQVLYRFSGLVSSVFSVPQLLEHMLDVAFETMPIARGCVLLYEPPTSDDLIPVAARTHRGTNERIVVPKQVIQRVVETQEALLLTNLEADQHFVRDAAVRELGITTAICAPISARQSMLGVLYLDSATSDGLGESQLQMVSAISSQAGMAIENARLFDISLKAERVNATGETVAYLSHYIKNILQGLRGGADIVNIGIERGELELIKSGWKVVGKNSDKIYDLVLNMLAFSKDREPRREPTNINTIVRDVLDLAKPRCSAKSVMLIDQLDEHLPPVAVDTTGIHHALLNIVTNAIDAVPAEHGVITVRTRFDEHDQSILTSISDNGPGIPPHMQEEVFTPLHSSKGHAGTGLGLTVARKLTREHGGDIRLRSVLGEGTEFTVWLPVQRPGDLPLDDTSGAVVLSDTQEA